MVSDNGAPEAPATSETGAQESSDKATRFPTSIQDYAMAPGRGGGTDALAREVMHFPQGVEQFITRTQLTEREVLRKKRIRARWNIFHVGYSNIPSLDWYELGLRVSINRQGRREMVDVLMAERRVDRAGAKGLLKTARDMDKQEIVGPGAS